MRVNTGCRMFHCPKSRKLAQHIKLLFCDICRVFRKLLPFSNLKAEKFLAFVAKKRKVCAMPRKKLGFDQRLNFWVSQDSYDFYSEMAEKRGDKLSELLREVLDYAKDFFDEEGRFELEATSDQEWIRDEAEKAASKKFEELGETRIKEAADSYFRMNAHDLLNKAIAENIEKFFAHGPKLEDLLNKTQQNLDKQWEERPSTDKKSKLPDGPINHGYEKHCQKKAKSAKLAKDADQNLDKEWEQRPPRRKRNIKIDSIKKHKSDV